MQGYYTQAEQIEELKRSTQFPKLTPTSPEFLTLMEEYVREAPRPQEEEARVRLSLSLTCSLSELNFKPRTQKRLLN